MGKPQIITASNGEELVVLTRPEYEALLEAAEELADIAALDAAMSDIDNSKLLTAEETAERLRR